MAKYIIDVPDEKIYAYVNEDKTFLRVPISAGENNIKSVFAPTMLRITPYTEPDEQSVKNNNIHLCWSCQNNSYPECPAKVKDILFGDDVGNDNICCCNAYRPTESNASDEDEIRHKVEQEVWEFATMLMRMHPDVAEDIYWSMNGGKGIGVAAEMTYQEAKTAYNAWKNRNICVGDEVIYDSRTKAVVLIPETKERYGTILTDDFATIVVSHDELEKTGIHFDDIAELLKKMREE